MTTPTTFYNHFKDKFDLVQWIYAKKEDEFINKIDEDYTWYHAALVDDQD